MRIAGPTVRFFTRPSDSHKFSRFIRTVAGTELDWEAAYLAPQELVKFNGTIFVCEQKLGDLVLVPPRSAHQVVNKGGLTIKTSWSRMTAMSANEAVKEECPIYRRSVCAHCLWLLLSIAV